MKISTIHHFAKNPFILALMIVSILSSSFMSLQAVSTHTNTAMSKDQLFNAIYFLDGDLVSQVPALQRMSNYTAGEKSAADFEMQGRISQAVDNIDRTFKSRLLNAVNSKDQYSISSTIKEGGELILLASAKIADHSEFSDFPDISKYNLKNAKDKQQAISVLTKYYTSQPDIQEEYGKYACALAAIAFAVAIYLFIYFWGHEQLNNPDTIFKVISSDKSMSHERLVEQLTQIR